MRTFNFIQGSPDWYAIRRGRPTGSEFGRIITPAKGEYAAGADAYAAELIAQSLGWSSGFQGTPDTERGNAMEKEALRWYSFVNGVEHREVGFCLSDCGRYGCSPDALLADGTPVEVKCPDLHTFIKWRIAFEKTGEIPNEHKAQVHGEMFCTNADRCIFIAYPDHSALDRLVVEVRRDDFTAKLGAHVLTFCDRLDELRAKLLGEEAEFYQPKIPQAA